MIARIQVKKIRLIYHLTVKLQTCKNARIFKTPTTGIVKASLPPLIILGLIELTAFQGGDLIDLSCLIQLIYVHNGLLLKPLSGTTPDLRPVVLRVCCDLLKGVLMFPSVKQSRSS